MLAIVLSEDIAHGQYAQPCRAPSSHAFKGEAIPESGRFVEWVPSLCVSERYDSNVFYRSSARGLDREDYVTSVNPMLRVNHKGNYATGFLEAGGVSETYVKNSGLNFLGSNGTLSLNFDNTVKRVLPDASVSILDTVNYTPLPPGFVNPVAGTNPIDLADTQDVFAQGLISSRSNRVSNRGSVLLGYDTSATTRVNASYSHSILRSLDSSPNVLFNTTTQVGNVGGGVQLTSSDRLSVSYNYRHSEIERGLTAGVTFQAHTGMATWSRVITPNLTAEAGGGGIVLDSGRTTYAVNAALILKNATTRATVHYSRSAFPSYIGVATQVVGDVVALSAVHELGPQWQLTGSGNYARSSGNSVANPIEFNTYGGALNLAYLIYRGWTTAVGYTYLRFDREFGTVRDQFDRHVVMLSVRATWE